LIPALRENPIRRFSSPPRSCLWHYQAVITLVRIFFHLLGDFTALLALPIRPRRSIEAENLFLRRQLALYQERGIKPRRVDAATRISLVLLPRLFDWRSALVVVETGDLDPLASSRGSACSGASSHGRDVRRFRWSCAS
jgi:hypothetical protein